MSKLRRCLSTGRDGVESHSTHQGMGKWGNEVNGMNGLGEKVSQGTHVTIVMIGRKIVMSHGYPHPSFYSFSHLFRVLSPWLGFWALPRVLSPLSLIFSSFRGF